MEACVAMAALQAADFFARTEEKDFPNPVMDHGMLARGGTRSGQRRGGV